MVTAQQARGYNDDGDDDGDDDGNDDGDDDGGGQRQQRDEQKP